MIPAPPWSLSYADGSANVFRFTATASGVHVVYDPVTPATSSTGMYSGGAPLDAQLAPDDPRIAMLWQHVRGLEADTAHHVADRCKGDGALTIDGRTVLIARAATRTFEAWLTSAILGPT
ncbi:MAG: hypothetical protein JNL83_36620 [Myxococcales bacterium]|nr:hypothetical protein [Myxococcales bacterium]